MRQAAPAEQPRLNFRAGKARAPWNGVRSDAFRDATAVSPAHPLSRRSRPIPLAPLLARYGLLAVLLGAGLEGEAVVLSGGVLARRGVLPFWGVAAAAVIGSCVVDQFWFLAGRSFRDRSWVRRLRGRAAFARALALLEAHSTWFILGFRFIYGLRTVSPVAIGTSQVPVRRFVVLNAVSALVWGPAIAWAGYGLGGVIEPVWHRLASGPGIAVAALVVLVGAGLAWWHTRAPRSS